MRPAMGASEGEGTRYVVSIPLSMDGLGIGLKNGPDGCPYVAHLDAGGEAEGLSSSADHATAGGIADALLGSCGSLVRRLQLCQL